MLHRAQALAAVVLWCAVAAVAKAELREELDRILVEERLTGVAWTLVAASGEVRVGAAGLRDGQAGSAFTPGTRFHVGSLTKSVLATGVLRLASEGRIDLDAPAERYLPGLSFNNPWSGSSEVTVRQLLDHTAGLDDARLWHLFSERADPNGPLVDAFPEPESLLQIRSRPGRRFSYSNIGYTLLGMVIESVTGERYETYLDRHVLGPLAMRDSTFAFTTQEGKGADPTLAWGHVDDGSRYAASPVFLRPAGQFTTTAADLARFATFLLGDGTLAGESFIDNGLMRSRGKAYGTEAANAGLEAGYALGIARRDRHGVVGYCHGGNVVGFVARLCVFPRDRSAFAYSVNTDSETADYGRLDKLFIDALGLAPATRPPVADPAADIAEWHGHYVLSPNRFRMFEYLDTVFGAVRISADSGGLALSSMQNPDRQLQPAGERLYSANDRSTTSHVFYRDENDDLFMSDGFQTFAKVTPARLLAHWTSVVLALAGMAWILLAGTVSLFRHRSGLFRRVEAPAYSALLLLSVPVPFFATQSFMALGDLTLASALLAVVTLLLPFGMLATVLRARKVWRESWAYRLHGMAAVLVLQWLAVLFAAGMLPFRLWV